MNFEERKLTFCHLATIGKNLLPIWEALSEVKTLSGLLPICSSCKKIRDDNGYWNQIEIYIREHSKADFTHSVCPECAKKLYPEFHDKIWEKKNKDISK